MRCVGSCLVWVAITMVDAGRMLQYILKCCERLLPLITFSLPLFCIAGIPRAGNNYKVKGWVRENALRLSRPSIGLDIEDTTTSTCWCSKCLWSQLLSCLGAAISGHWDLGDTGTWRDYNALVRSLGWQCECMARILPGAVPVARWTGAVRPDSPAKPTYGANYDRFWAPPLLAIGTWETQGLGETITLLCVSWVAVWVYGPYLARRCACGTLNGSSAARFPSQAYLWSQLWSFLGAAITGHWDLGDTGTWRDYNALVRLLGGSVNVWPVSCPALCLWHAEREQCGQILRTKNVTFSSARLLIWLRPLTAKRANKHGENVHISHSTTPIVLILVSGDLGDLAVKVVMATF